MTEVHLFDRQNN